MNQSQDELLKQSVLKEVELAVSDNKIIKLRKPADIYYEIYAEAKRRAKKAKQQAIEACLEAKRIKNTYMLKEIDHSDESDDENIEYGEHNI